MNQLTKVHARSTEHTRHHSHPARSQSPHYFCACSHFHGCSLTQSHSHGRSCARSHSHGHYHTHSHSLSSRTFLQPFTFLFHFLFLPSTQLPHTHFVSQTLTTMRQDKEMNTIGTEGLAVQGGLQFYAVDFLLQQDDTSVLSLGDQLPHHLQQATLLRCLPGSQYLLFLPELTSHLSQLP